MPIYVVRHASAGSRHDWSGDDFERPLDARGRDQADAIADALADRGVTRLLSSRAVRCSQTLGPLAARTGLSIDEAAELTEGASGDDAARLAHGLIGDTAVLCSHGDVIPAMVRSLVLAGLELVGPQGCEKGSIWQIDAGDIDLRRATYLGLPTRERLDS